MEQYQRRLCLRINGIQRSADESAEDCLEKVKSLFKAELNMEIPELAIDRAHRISRVSHAEKGKKYQSIIVPEQATAIDICLHRVSNPGSI